MVRMAVMVRMAITLTMAVTRNQFTSHMPWGPHRLNALIMETHPGSRELPERIRVTIKGLDGWRSVNLW